MSASRSEVMMRRAVAVSRRGFPAPNPHVGCVLAHEDRIVGEGWHAYAGGDHAEVAAMNAAGPAARGATAYVTLEPCNHHGRTPPCTEALMAAGVARVVVACPDPNPRACGGLKRLSEAGIGVEMGIMAEEAAAANRVFLSAMKMGRPYVTIKAAASLDGRIALPSGESKWITGPAARREAHRLRAESSAVVVGRRTVEIDDPELTARLPGVINQPIPIVLDPRGRLSGQERVFAANRSAISVGGPGSGRSVEVPLTEDGLDLTALLTELWRRGHTSLLVEGGARTIGGFLQAGLADRLELFVAPMILGSGTAWVEGLTISSIAEALGTGRPKVTRRANDLQVSCDFLRNG